MPTRRAASGWIVCLLLGMAPLPAWCQTACGPSFSKAEGVVTESGSFETVGGNPGMGYAFGPNGSLKPTGMTPGGPDFLWVIRAVGDDRRALAQEQGLALAPGKVYAWKTDGKQQFPPATLKDLSYLCDFDQSLSDKELIALFLKEPPEPKNPLKALIYNARKGDLARVNALISAKTNVNAADGNENALSAAAHGGHVEVVKALLAAHANPNARPPHGDAALFLAALDGHADFVAVLLAAGANPNVKDEVLGWTPLIAASGNGHIDVVRELLGAKANANITSNDGTALTVATKHRRADVADLLRQHGAK